MQKRLYRSETDRILWGVCGGLSQYFDIDPTIIRIIAVASIFIGWGIIAYIILAMVIPSERSRATEPKETVKENIEEFKVTAENLGEEVRQTFAASSEVNRRQMSNRRFWLGIILIAIGIIVVLANLYHDLFWWFRWTYLWPVILIIIGLLIIFGRRKGR